MPKTKYSNDLNDYGKTRRFELKKRMKINNFFSTYIRNDHQPHEQESAHAHSSTVINHSVVKDDVRDHDEVFNDDMNENVFNETLMNNINIDDYNHHDSEDSNDREEFNDDNESEFSNDLEEDCNDQEEFVDDNESEFSNDLEEDCNDQEEFVDDNESEFSNDHEAENEKIQDNDPVTDDDNSIDDADINDDEYNRPLYDGAPLSLAESLLSIFTFYITSNMTGVNFDKLLSLMALHFPASSIFKKTRHLFMKYFIHGQTPMIKHWYCSKCMSYCQNENSKCQCDGNPERWYFIEMSIIDQLQRLFMKPGFSDDLIYPYSRVKLHPNNIEDIYDGKIYREHASLNNPFSNPYNLSFMWYTDGAPVFKSCKYSVWPLYLTINELSYKKRIQKDNVIIAGIWFGSTDPVANMYLRPLYNQMFTLGQGVNIKMNGNITKLVKATLLCGTCDALARADFLNHMRFNGYYGCPRCLSKGCNISEEDNFGNTHVYPYEQNLILRTKESHEEHVKLALESGSPHFGVKGPSILDKLMPNMIRAVSVDVMHCVYLGVVKKIFSLWIDSSFGRMPFSLRQLRSIIDDRLMKIAPPSFVKRMPRSLSNHFKYFKASEFKTLFLYYSIPILHDLMEPQYWQHYLQLVLGIFYLNQSSISPDCLGLSKKLLTSFVSNFESLYGPQHMSFNIHSLLHLPDIVEDLGPLWVTSCFIYEDLLGKMINYVHGTRYIGIQIYSKITHHISISNKMAMLNEASDIRKFCKNLLMTGHRITKSDNRILENTYIVDTMKCLQRFPRSLEQALIRIGYNNWNNLNICLFQKLLRFNQIIHARNYKRKTKTVSNCIIIETDDNQREIGFVEGFIKLCTCMINRGCKENCNNAKFYAIFKRQEVLLPFSVSSDIDVAQSAADIVNNRVVIPYIYEISRENTNIRLVKIENIITLCYTVTIGKATYLLSPANIHEYDQ